MIGRKATIPCSVVFGALLVAACQTDSREQVLAVSMNQLALRSIQSRVFDTTDRTKTLRTVVSTLQDLNFVIHDSSMVLGTVSGAKIAGLQAVRMTVTVRSRGDKQVLVRANAQQGLESIVDPKPYQDFFSALGKAMFLTVHQVD